MTITRRTTVAALALAGALLAWACADLSVDGGGELAFTFTPSQTSATVGTEIQFDYDVQGTYLNGVIIDYGDGSKHDSVPTSGAQSAKGNRLYTYGAPGEYRVIGTVEDAVRGSLSREVTIEITPGSS